MKTLFFVLSFFFAVHLQAFDATIPVLHLPDYYDVETREAFIKTLENALKDVGFFAVTGVDFEQGVLDEAYDELQKFFSLEVEEKQKYQGPNGQRGFVLSESAKDEQKMDYKEFYHIGRELSAGDLARLGYAENVWPEDPTFQNSIFSLFKILDSFKDIIGEAIALTLEKEENFINEMTCEGDCLIRLLHYPSNPPKEEIWAGAHTDIDLFTILPRATAKGLQVLNKEGKWIDVLVPEGAFIVNGGDMLENLSNGYFKSSWHRVIDPGLGEERFSIVYFIHPRADDRLDPLSDCIDKTGGERLYANVTRIELLAERLIDLGLASEELMEFFIDSGAIERLREVGRFSPKAEQALIERGFIEREFRVISP